MSDGLQAEPVLPGYDPAGQADAVSAGRQKAGAEVVLHHLLALKRNKQ
jgi:hypothetical protein